MGIIKRSITSMVADLKSATRPKVQVEAQTTIETLRRNLRKPGITPAEREQLHAQIKVWVKRARAARNSRIIFRKKPKKLL